MSQTCKRRILIVDDDPIIVELLIIFLEMKGYEVFSVSDGAQAVGFLQGCAPGSQVELIMLDLMMPVMDGLCFLHWLRTDAKLALPVLALTGMNQPTDVQRAIGAGADAVLSKPLELQRIAMKLAELLNAGAGAGCRP